MENTLENAKNFFGENNMECFTNQQMNVIGKTMRDYAEQFSKKAEKWDKLSEKIAKCYVDENGDELSEEDSEDIDLCTIGEIAARAFGWL
jgi:hypothetical protein